MSLFGILAYSTLPLAINIKNNTVAIKRRDRWITEIEETKNANGFFLQKFLMEYQFRIDELFINGLMNNSL